MAEEFQESEVIFSEIGQENHRETCNFQGNPNSREFLGGGNSNKPKRKKNKKKKNSVPVSIPEKGSESSWFQYGDHSDFFDEEEDERVPPHVILGRRISGKMAFSVCTGNGRTLKGRDLSEVRNSILRMTGFLET
ncbi:hypothetical protein RJ639_011473 [Escallonia herrerae]|uniref:Senescence regulator n=1 Tax=Escallonia herrerae TaxID=1293975 RepID=A0AA88VPC0_9ASTE|nr:hypothetical protein RJ639_018416 [Escallonia herrerae]KAK3011298.1 hypothetical protein RJ639_011473 [Escallonia herrerae]